jgi:hypothetical protein
MCALHNCIRHGETIRHVMSINAQWPGADYYCIWRRAREGGEEDSLTLSDTQLRMVHSLVNGEELKLLDYSLSAYRKILRELLVARLDGEIFDKQEFCEILVAKYQTTRKWHNKFNFTCIDFIIWYKLINKTCGCRLIAPDNFPPSYQGVFGAIS